MRAWRARPRRSTGCDRAPPILCADAPRRRGGGCCASFLALANDVLPARADIRLALGQRPPHIPVAARPARVPPTADVPTAQPPVGSRAPAKISPLLPAASPRPGPSAGADCNSTTISSGLRTVKLRQIVQTTISGWGRKMACVDDETLGRLASLVDSSYALSSVLALAIASSPPGELSPDQMDVLTDLSYKILINIAETRETLAQVSDKLGVR